MVLCSICFPQNDRYNKRGPIASAGCYQRYFPLLPLPFPCQVISFPIGYKQTLAWSYRTRFAKPYVIANIQHSIACPISHKNHQEALLTLEPVFPIPYLLPSDSFHLPRDKSGLCKCLKKGTKTVCRGVSKLKLLPTMAANMPLSATHSCSKLFTGQSTVTVDVHLAEDHIFNDSNLSVRHGRSFSVPQNAVCKLIISLREPWPCPPARKHLPHWVGPRTNVAAR